MDNILLPSKISFEQGENPNEGVLNIEPCYYGYGTTLGNALRRVLLSSLPGAAVTAVRMSGVSHEFQSIEGVREDAVQVILNLKSLRMKVHTDQSVKLSLKTKGPKVLTAADFEANADVEIINGDLEIANITEKIDFEIEILIESGRGYQATEQREEREKEIGMIAIDALFSPVRNVGYKVVNTRVGEITNYDKLIMNIETDGTITPEEAVKQSSDILINYFSLLTEVQGSNEIVADKDAAESSPESDTE